MGHKPGLLEIEESTRRACHWPGMCLEVVWALPSPEELLPGVTPGADWNGERFPRILFVQLQEPPVCMMAGGPQ